MNNPRAPAGLPRAPNVSPNAGPVSELPTRMSLVSTPPQTLSGAPTMTQTGDGQPAPTLNAKFQELIKTPSTWYILAAGTAIFFMLRKKR